MRALPLAVLLLAGAACREPAPASDVDAGAPAPAPDAATTDARTSGPHVVTTTPRADAAGVALGVTVSAWFSRRMDPATFDATTFTLTRDGQPVAGTVVYDEDSGWAHFRPAVTLARQATYRATLGPTITDSDGAPLVAPVTWAFTTAARGWDGNVLVGEGAPNSQFAAVVDPGGTVHVSWVQRTASAYQHWVRPYVPGEGWQPARARLADAPGAGLVVGNGGHVVSTWRTGASLYVARFVPGAGWATPVRFNHRELDELDGVQVVIDASGDITAYWYDEDRSADLYGAWVRRQDVDGTLHDPVSFTAVGGPAPETARRHQPLLAAHGARVALYWQEQLDAQYSLWTSHDDGSGWSPRALVAGGHAVDMDAVTDAAGDVRLVWESFDDPDPTQLSAVEHAGTWSAPTELSRGQTIWHREVRRAPDGVLHAIWSELDAWSMWTARFVPGIGWETPVALDDKAYVYNRPQTVIDEDGVVYVLYQDVSPSGTIVTARRRVPGTGWEPAAPIADLGHVGPTVVRIVALPGGGAMALWCALDAVDQPCHLWASTYH